MHSLVQEYTCTFQADLMIKKERFPIVLFAMIALLSGLWSGLSRIGWTMGISPIMAHHGAIMVGGFIGTLIMLATGFCAAFCKSSWLAAGAVCGLPLACCPAGGLS